MELLAGYDSDRESDEEQLTEASAKSKPYCFRSIVYCTNAG